MWVWGKLSRRDAFTLSQVTASLLCNALFVSYHLAGMRRSLTSCYATAGRSTSCRFYAAGFVLGLATCVRRSAGSEQFAQSIFANRRQNFRDLPHFAQIQKMRFTRRALELGPRCKPPKTGGEKSKKSKFIEPWGISGPVVDTQRPELFPGDLQNVLRTK